MSSVQLEVHSTFGHSMTVKDVLPLHPQPSSQFWYRGTVDGQAHTLRPDTRTAIGKLHYDPKNNCGNQCYAGFTLSDKR